MRNAVDESARRPSIFGGVVARQHRKFLDCIGAEIYPAGASGRAIRVIVNADPVDAIVILLRTVAGYSQLITIAAVTTRGRSPAGILSSNTRNPRLQGSQTRPVAPVDRHLTNVPLTSDPTYCRTLL